MTWKRTALAVLALLACSKEPGAISLNLDLSSLPEADRGNIEGFLFLVSPSDASSQILYPRECIGCLGGDGVTNCSEAENCVKKALCGDFTKASPAFRLTLSFDFFAEGTDVVVTACAVGTDNTQLIAQGSATLANTQGGTGTIPMIAASTACKAALAGYCPW